MIYDFLANIVKTLQIKPICRNDEDYIREKRLNDPIYLERYDYKVYSQNDEDGFIDEIFNRIGTTNKSFVEFGVGNGLECNGHYLLHKGWNGLWIEGSKKYVKQINKIFEKPINANKLMVLNNFINIENINSLISVRKKGSIDLLSIDIDGNDYWIWEAINCIDPRVVIIEYNSKFPPPYEWIMPYNPKHCWDCISDYYGASLESLCKLGNKLGYQLVGTSMKGLNAFFVKQELAGNLFPLPATASNLYNPKRLLWYFNSGDKTVRYTGVL